MSVSIENFLKNIYLIRFDFGEKANSSNLAGRLNISHAAVTDMARKLSAKGLIEYKKYKEIKLTSEGKLKALSIIRRHRLWESFLSSVLNLPPDDIHNEAEMLEHQTSEKLLNKIDEYLGFPEYDPHGDPIPDSTGKLPQLNTFPLIEAEIGKEYRIGRIQYNNTKFHAFFIKNNFMLEEKIRLEEVFDGEQSLSIQYNEKQIILNSNIASCIHIKPKS